MPGGGDTSYSDYSLFGSPPTATLLKSYEPGLAQFESGANDGDDDTKYYLTDHLGNTASQHTHGALTGTNGPL